MLTEGQTEERTDVTKLLVRVAILSFAKASINVWVLRKRLHIDDVWRDG